MAAQFGENYYDEKDDELNVADMTDYNESDEGEGTVGCQDNVTGRFLYKQVDKEDFGLSVADILCASDDLLTKYTAKSFVSATSVRVGAREGERRIELFCCTSVIFCYWSAMIALPNFYLFLRVSNLGVHSHLNHDEGEKHAICKV